jgi:hypothetical protein
MLAVYNRTGANTYNVPNSPTYQGSFGGYSSDFAANPQLLSSALGLYKGKMVI